MVENIVGEEIMAVTAFPSFPKMKAFILKSLPNRPLLLRVCTAVQVFLNHHFSDFKYVLCKYFQLGQGQNFVSR